MPALVDDIVDAAVFGDRPVEYFFDRSRRQDVRDQFLRADPCYACNASASRSRATTRQPSCARRRAVARPIPDAAPVTSATDPFRVIKAPFVIHYNYSKTGMSTCLGRLMGSGISPLR